MFEKWSPVKSSVSWGGFGAVWVQTPRQAKETHSSFATSCTLAEQARPHQNCRPLQIFINSPLLTSPLVFPWNKRTHKILSPLLFPSKRLSPWEETKTCSPLILSDPGKRLLALLFSSWGHCPHTFRSCVLPLPCPALPRCSHNPFGHGKLSPPAPATKHRT